MKIISLEGIVGVGKTTQQNNLFSFLQPNALVMPELNIFNPLKGVIAEWKGRVHSCGGIITFQRHEIEALARARAAVEKMLLQQLQHRFIYAITDRSVYTSIVFEQGEVGPEEIADINRKYGVSFPDLCFILDCNPKEALKRVDARRQKAGIYKLRSIHEDIPEMQKRRELYLTLAERYPTLKIVDASANEQKVFKEIVGYFQNEDK